MEGLPMTRTAVLDELVEYHEQLTVTYQNVRPEDIKQTSDTMGLVTFNGYYTMSGAKGAFFTVDTNIHVKSGSSTAIYDVALLVCLDGKNSIRVPFNGTFDGIHLSQTTSTPKLRVQIELTFVRGGLDGTTASFSGTIAMDGKRPVTVNGSTYNNPIGYGLYIGEYYETPKAKDSKPVPVMRIEPKYQLKYDYGTNDGVLKAVPGFTYNMNMYFFSFPQGSHDNVRLIMGTAAAKGFACNNMTVNKKTEKLVARSLLTIPSPHIHPAPEKPSVQTILDSAILAKFSGYYPMASIAQGAFISIQAEYACVDGMVDLYSVGISYSLDGATASGYTFDAETMSFENNTLTMPQQGITLTFGRVYTSTNRGLASVAGSLPGFPRIIGSTPFNPVPLSAFGGAPMTTSDGKSPLTIVSDNEVVYHGEKVTTFIYVPLMYILYAKGKLMLSLGTDGLSGNTCILTDYTEDGKVSLLTAVHPS